MGDYMASLDKLRGRDETIYWPGHGGPVTEPQRFLRALAHHRRQREASILNRVAAGDRTIPAMVPAIYQGLIRRSSAPPGCRSSPISRTWWHAASWRRDGARRSPPSTAWFSAPPRTRPRNYLRRSPDSTPRRRKRRMRDALVPKSRSPIRDAERTSIRVPSARGRRRTVTSSGNLNSNVGRPLRVSQARSVRRASPPRSPAIRDWSQPCGRVERLVGRRRRGKGERSAHRPPAAPHASPAARPAGRAGSRFQDGPGAGEGRRVLGVGRDVVDWRQGRAPEGEPGRIGENRQLRG